MSDDKWSPSKREYYKAASITRLIINKPDFAFKTGAEAAAALAGILADALIAEDEEHDS